MKYFFVFIALSTLIYYSVGCNKGPSHGEQLAISYCGACHLYPKPDLLDKKTWTTGVLPEMAMFMGIEPIESNPKINLFEAQKISNLGVIPTTPMLSKGDWKEIVDFYTKNAPDKLPENPPIKYHSLDSLYEIKEFHLAIKPQNELLVNVGFTMLKYDKANNLLNFGTKEGELIQLNTNEGKIKTQFIFNSPPTDIVARKDHSFGIAIAGKLEPNHDTAGFCILTKFDKNKLINPQYIKGLPRPVNLAFADLNQDKIEDAVICSFGFFTGKLAWYEFPPAGSPPNTRPKEHILRRVAGATQAIIKDMNHDNLPDIVALFGQGNEGVFIYYNKGSGEFEEEQALRFPPVYGSIHIELLDYNKDGFEDIVYSNGDNGDKSMIYKPYHGLRIFQNDGKNHFNEKIFFPIHGIIKSITNDFDHDGDLDIACISFFPEYENSPQKSFVFLQNQGNLKFTPYISSKTDVGRWMVMDTYDENHDGSADFILGAAYDYVRFSKTNIPLKPLLLLQSKQMNKNKPN